MIIDMKPLSMAEAKDLADSSEEVSNFIKKFAKLDAKDAKKIREELEASEIIKIKEEHIVKIIDLQPEDAADINKIFVDVSLDENEINKILEIVKKF